MNAKAGNTMAPEAPAATEGTPSTESTPSTQPEGPKLFTQEQVNSLVANQKREISSKYADYDTLKDSHSKRESEIEAAKTAAKEEVRLEVASKSVNTSAKSIARDLKFHNADDALIFQELDKLPLKDGEPDEAAIKTALEDLVKKRPYLAVTEAPKRQVGKPKLPEGKPDENDKPGKLTAAEALRQMRAQRKH